jgi:hypothetical protein
MKRRRRVGDARAQRRGEFAARRAAEKAEEDEIRKQLAVLDASVREERSADPDRFGAPFAPELSARLDVTVARFEAIFSKFETKLRDANTRLRAGDATMAQFFENAHREADRTELAADAATRHILEQLRSGQLTRKHLAVLARAIAAQLGETEIAVRDTRAAREADVNEFEKWSRSVAIAGEGGRPDLAEAARDHAMHWRRNVSARDTALHELLELYERLSELGRLVLKAAG